MTEKVKEIIKKYSSENPGVISKIARFLNQGKLAGTGRLVILPVDQGFEHGPTRSFGLNPQGFDPRYHAELAIEAGLNAYAAPLGFLESVAREFAGEIPLILKANSSDLLSKSGEPIPAVTSTVEDALRLGCAGIGFTIYPGSGRSKEMYEELRALIASAKAHGLAAIVWAYPRGMGLSKEGETALDVVAYAAHIACELGAHIVKVKLPTAYIEKKEAKEIIEQEKIKIDHLSDRIRHVVQSAFNGSRLVIFSGGPAKSVNEILKEAEAIHKGGGSGSIIGRNAFQRSKKEALELLKQIIKIYSN